MSIEKQEIDAVIHDIETSDLRPAHQKDIRRTLLLSREAINGSTDKIQSLCEAVAGLNICFANDARFRREDFRALFTEMISGHELKCSVMTRLPETVIEIMKAHAIKEGMEWDGLERRGRDGRDGRDFVAKTPAGRFSGPAWALAVISLCAVAIVAMFKFG